MIYLISEIIFEFYIFFIFKELHSNILPYIEMVENLRKVTKDEVLATFFFYIHLFICAYIVWVIYPPCPCLLFLLPLTLLPGRTCSALFSNFVEE
jgi:hypothetical protein